VGRRVDRTVISPCSARAARIGANRTASSDAYRIDAQAIDVGALDPRGRDFLLTRLCDLGDDRGMSTRLLSCDMVLLLGLAAAPASASDQTRIERLIDRVAPFVESGRFKPRVACVCRDAGAQNTRAGVVARVAGSVLCLMPAYDAEGNLGSGTTLCGAFDVLGR
jgi:hypothetical protein